MGSNYLEKAKKIFEKDIYATQTTKIEIIDVDENYAKCKFDVGDIHKNANNVVMGGAIFTLADFTFAVAANASGNTTVSFSAQITYLSPANNKELIAEAICIKNGKTTCYYEVLVKDETEKQVAKVVVNGFKV